jgi:hypothetical protein
MRNRISGHLAPSGALCVLFPLGAISLSQIELSKLAKSTTTQAHRNTGRA